MCMSCGCEAADASKIPVKEAVKNIETTLRTKKPRSVAGRG